MDDSESYKRQFLEPTVPEISVNVEELFSTYAFFYTKNYSFQGEYHDLWELVYVDSGEVEIETPEYKVLLSKEHALLHTPNEKHKIRANNAICNVYNISFKCGCTKLFDIAQKPICVSSMLKDYIIRIVDEGQFYLAGKNYIPHFKFKTTDYASGQFLKNLIEILLIELIRQNDAGSDTHKENNLTNSDKSLVSYIVNFMNDNIRKKLKVDDIASNVGYSASYIGALFKKAMGISIMNYFIQLRIEKAKKLIMEEKMAIWQISEYLSYDSVQYFSSQFKKTMRITPTQYAAFIKAQRCIIDKSVTFQLKQTDD